MHGACLQWIFHKMKKKNCKQRPLLGAHAPCCFLLHLCVSNNEGQLVVKCMAKGAQGDEIIFSQAMLVEEIEPTSVQRVENIAIPLAFPQHHLELVPSPVIHIHFNPLSNVFPFLQEIQEDIFKLWHSQQEQVGLVAGELSSVGHAQLTFLHYSNAHHEIQLLLLPC